MAERTNPAELRQPSLGPPVVGGPSEQIVNLFAENRARVGSQVLDAVLGEPLLDFGERVDVLFGMLVLIASPTVRCPST